MPRSCDRVPRELATKDAQILFRVLSSIQNASFVGEGLAGAASDSAARNGVGCVGAASRWATPPLRTTGCLKPRAARCIFLGLELAPEGSLLHRYIGKFRFARLRRAASWLRLRFVADMTPPWAVRDFQEGQVPYFQPPQIPARCLR